MNKTNELKKSAQAVQDVLDAHGLNCRVIEFPEGTRTSVDAARAVGADLGQIAKTLIFKTKKTDRPVLISASGPNRVDERVIAREIGEKITKADANFVKEVTGFAIGGVSPFATRQNIELVFIDKDLLQFDTVWVAAGTPNAVFEMKTSDLVSIIGGKIISIV